ncbi:Phosphoglycerate Mutase 1 [Manis pentadactyla]|nr:Phosphoglycerate Mutase 1 [Manis pentadactyla]
MQNSKSLSEAVHVSSKDHNTIVEDSLSSCELSTFIFELRGKVPPIWNPPTTPQTQDKKVYLVKHGTKERRDLKSHGSPAAARTPLLGPSNTFPSDPFAALD